MLNACRNPTLVLRSSTCCECEQNRDIDKNNVCANSNTDIRYRKREDGKKKSMDVAKQEVKLCGAGRQTVRRRQPIGCGHLGREEADQL